MPSADETASAHADDESSSRRAFELNAPRWFHVWFSTFGTWLRGDARGFRDRDHRVHSSGDYRDPPPSSQHQALRRWCVRNMHKPPVRLSPAQQRRALHELVLSFDAQRIQLLVVAVTDEHVHALIQSTEAKIRSVVGNAKRQSSHAMRSDIPGRLWAKNRGLRRIMSYEQHVATFGYILKHAGHGACVWTFREPLPVRARRLEDSSSA